jgi:uncharacterized SAM-binding protein YcdF (DUF218 family)
MQKLRRRFGIFCKWFFGLSGALTFCLLLLSFTDVPYYAYHYLGTCNAKLYHRPDVIVLLGGAGMPSPDGLMRCYYTAEAAKENKKAEIVIALPAGEVDSLKQSQLMARELIIRGVDSTRIRFEAKGFNTHSQAEQIAAMYGAGRSKMNLLLVTSPEHMYRSVKVFCKMNFAHVGGHASFEQPVDEDQVEDTDTRKDTRVKSLALRYNMWSYLQYELLVLKEYCAISYYALKGWI